MKLKLLIVALFCSVLGWGQTTIALQDFETTPATPTLAFANTNGGNSTGTNPVSGLPASANLFVSGLRGWEVLNATSTLTFANQSLVGYTNSFVEFKLAGMSTNNTNGIDGADLVTVSISVDGGATYSSELTIGGAAANQYWSFAASGSTISTYDGNNTPTAITSSTATGVSYVRIDIPNIYSQIRVRIAMLNNAASERWVIDDVKILGTPVSSNTITTDTAITGSPFCVSASTGASVSVPFTSVGTFNAGNVYTAQLSNAAGSFASPVSIGSVTSTANSGTIAATIPAGTAAGTGYRIRVVSSNPVVTGTDNTVNLTVQIPAAITTQPSTTVQNLCQGSAATALSVAATGTTLTYQWYSNTTATTSGGTPVGTNSASYTPVTTATGTLYYYCVVTAACGASVTSNVSGAVNVTAIPSAPSGTINVSANPSCGAATLTYSAPNANIYWQTSATGTSTANPTTSSFTSLATAGTYIRYVRELNGTCWGPSTSVTFTVVAPVNITGQPTNQSATTGNTATFSVTASNAAGYQWQVNTGSGWANIGGATSASYTTPAATLAMNGYQYQVIVTGNTPCGNVTSSAATLSVTTGPCLSENFNSNTLPAGWLQNGGTTFTGGEGVFGPQNCDLSTLVIAYPSNLTFDLRRTNNTNAKIFYVEVSTTTQSGTYTTIATYDHSNTTSAGTTSCTVDLSAYSSFPSVYIKFRKVSSTTSPWYLDNMSVFCATPPSGPEINITGNNITILDNDTTPSTADGTSFGSTVIGTPIIKTFTIHNQGTTNLVLSGPVTLTDVSAPQEFVISQPAITTIPAGGSTTFTVTFNSAVAGTFTNTINIGSNDTDEALYNFNIVATATNTPVTGGTIFNPGELIFVGYDGQINGSGQNDEYLVATLVDMLPGTTFSIVNSRYEAGAAANVRTDKWGGGGDIAEEAPYVAKITYTGAAAIPAGSVLRFVTDNSSAWFGLAEVTVGTTTTDRSADFTGLTSFTMSPNISTSGSDQLYLMQGDFVSDGSIDVGQANYYLNGTLLHGLTNRAAWVLLSSVCNGDDSGGNSRESRLPSALTCFNVQNVNGSAVSGYYENDKEHGLASIRQIINGVADVNNNWTLGTGRYTKDPSSNAANRAGKTFLIGAGNPAGNWVGNVDTNWFNCANWEGLAVPKTTTNVLVSSASMNEAVVDYNAPYSNEYGDLAVCNDLTITGNKVGVRGHVNNKLEVHGNLSLSGTGVLNMDDSNAATADGQLYLTGNWTNTIGNTAFEEGNGTVHFTGTNPQIINNVTPLGTEVFYNVVLNNNFTTAVSNDLIASGNLTVNTGKIVEVSPDDYIQVNENLINNGTFTVFNNGSLIQVNDSGVNIGNISYQRIASVKLQDYVYWSSPVSGFDVNSISPATPAYYHWEWNPTILNPNGGEGNWVNASTTMLGGKGYIVRAPNGFSNTVDQDWTATFNNGVPNNGVYTPSIARGTDLNAGTAGPNGVMRLATDDNWNLLGNPYPSAISISSFLAANLQLDGFVKLWTHGNLPSTSVTDPFYNNFVSNYTANDYIVLNGSGATSGPMAPGVIGAGQGFFVLMNPGAATTSTALFNNAMRSKDYSNSHFYRSSNLVNSSNQENIERHRIWLDLVGPTNETTRTLVAYVEGATLAKDRMFDAFTDYKLAQNFYSLIDDQIMTIQGRGLPFNQEDRVPLGVKIPSNGIYKIAIATVDGLFSSNQAIYLEDTVLGIIHDLRQAPYTFTGTSGIVNNRFVLRYTNETLGNDDFETLNDSVIVTTGNELTISSLKESIKEVIVYDVLGRLIERKSNINALNVTLSGLNKMNNALIIYVTLDNGNQVVKKIIY